MSAELHNWLQLLFRWAHVVASFVWLGLLYFFVLVNAQAMRAVTDGARRESVPQIMTRALYWFRWAAVWTWISGLLLAVLMYYLTETVSAEPGRDPWVWLAIFLGALIVALALYDVVMRTVRSPAAANALSFLLLAALYALLDRAGQFTGAALYIHVGMAMGSAMAMNVWLVIWPSQKRILGATRGGTAPPERDVRQVGARARQNAYMSVPLLFLMIANHYGSILGAQTIVAGLRLRDWYLLILFAAGAIVVRLMLDKAERIRV